MTTIPEVDNQDRPAPTTDANSHSASSQRPTPYRFQREQPHHVRQFLSIGVARASSRLAKAIPTRLRYWLADRLGDVTYWRTLGYRRNVLANLKRINRAAGAPPPTARDVRSVFHISSRNWADLLTVPGRSTAQFDEEVAVSTESIAHLDAALARGKGAVLITAHVGAFDFMGHFLHARGYKLTIVTGRTTARIVFDGVTYLRQSNGLSLVEATPSGVRRAIQTVLSGNCAVIVTDRDFFGNGVPVEFFSERTTLPPGAVRIARDTGASIVPVFGKRVGLGHQLTIHESFEIPRTADLAADIQVGMSRVVRAMEIGLCDAPNQWVMFQRVWPSEPADSAS
jgi:phosphatidylinositol dimannoside acyltransferase